MSRAAKSISLTDELQADLDAWIKEHNVGRGPLGCNADDEGEPNANGHQNLIAQPGTSCIEFRLMHIKSLNGSCGAAIEPFPQ